VGFGMVSHAKFPRVFRGVTGGDIAGLFVGG
jgi:hypothetical protein